ncbi:glycogen debranching N-terminal domain-containing protein [Reyranella sp.]|uniref:amylo-alpha-1,6-glucosidase n=1 Tax=Reyranella sp. TaxID=1929291 RepID=UPI003784DA8F
MKPTGGSTIEAALPIGQDVPAAEFFIPAVTSLAERRLRTLKHADSFGIFNPSGDAIAGPASPEGLFYRDTRHLSHFVLTLDEQLPILLASTVRDDNALLTCDLTNPDIHAADGRLMLEHDVIHIRRQRFLWKSTCHERLALRHFSTTPQTLRLGLSFAADFADLFEVRGSRRERRGVRQPAIVGKTQVELGYVGLDGLRRRSVLRFGSAVENLSANGAVFALVLQPGETRIIDLAVECTAQEEPRAPGRAEAFLPALRRARRAMRISAARAAVVTSANPTFNEAWRRAISDLYMLVTETEDGPFPYAGIPWFSTVFGRDSLITALQTLWLDPAIARGVLRHLARHQATAFDPASDAEPGKILHETRSGEMALLGEVPFRRYYGSVDSTPLFVMLAGAYLERTDDVDTLRALWPNIIAALRWMDESGDRDGDGFIEYRRQRDTGLVNQGWKDSNDSIFHADGSLAEGSVALVEIQAYAFGAWRAAAVVARRLGDGDAGKYAERADHLQRRFDAVFFDAAMGTYVLALDGNKKPCRVAASNAGHALFTGIALPERAAQIVKCLSRPEFFSGWGVRTLATDQPRYNPMSYHNGSVWPHDNALIAAGFARYGFRRQAARIFDGLFAASRYIDLQRLPELFCGFPRRQSHGPTPYPVACSPQAWATATPVSLLQSCLGLGFDTARGSVVFADPLLPDFLDDVALRRISLGGSSVDVALRRSESELAVEVTGRRGRIGVDLS